MIPSRHSRPFFFTALAGVWLIFISLSLSIPSAAQSPDAPQPTPTPQGVEAPLGRYDEPRSEAASNQPAAPSRFNGDPLPTPSMGFAGVSMAADDQGWWHTPPDTHAAAGIDRLVEVTNGHVAIYDKNGTLLAGGDSGPGRIDLNAFCGEVAEGESCYDPKILYDQYNNRFAAVALEGSTYASSKIHVMVSKTASPANLTSDWDKFTLDAGTAIGGVNGWTDYPGLGVSPDGLVVTGNIFSDPTPGYTFLGVKIRVFDKTELYDGDATATFVDLDLDVNDYGAFTVQPAHHFGSPPSGTFYLLQRTDSTTLQVWALDGVPAAPTISTELLTTANQGDCLNAAYALQMGTLKRLDVVCPRMMNAVWRDSSLWGTLTGSDVGDTRAVVQWFEVSTTNFPSGNPTLLQHGAIDGGEGEFTFMPSIGVDDCNNAVIVYTQSSNSRYPEIRYSGRLATDALDTLREPQIAQTSPSFYDDFSGPVYERWGDYSAAVKDPTDKSFWLAQEYVGTPAGLIGNDGKWATWLTRFSFETCQPPIVLSQIYLPLAMRNFDPLLIFADDFSSDTGWTQFSNADGAAGIQDGEYRLAWNHPNILLIGASPIPTDTIPTSFSIAVDARRFSGVNTGYGLVFNWISETDTYLFYVQPETQSYFLWKVTTTWQLLDDDTNTAILAGDSLNHLEIERQGTAIRMYANDTLLNEINDNTLSGGDIGLALVTGDSAGEARYDNFELRQLR